MEVKTLIVEVEKFDPTFSNIDEGDMPYQVYIEGKPLLNADGSIFITTDNLEKAKLL